MSEAHLLAREATLLFCLALGALVIAAFTLGAMFADWRHRRERR